MLNVNEVFAIEVFAYAWIIKRFASISKKLPVIPEKPIFLIFDTIENLYLLKRINDSVPIKNLEGRLRRKISLKGQMIVWCTIYSKQNISFSPDGTLKSVELKIMNLRPGIGSPLVWEEIGVWKWNKKYPIKAC